MYTDIPPLPLIALHYGGPWISLKEDQAVSWKKIVGLGILSGVTMLIRPTTIIVRDCLLGCALLQRKLEGLWKDCYGDGHDDGFCLCRIEYSGQSSKSCADLETRRLAKGPLLFINLGLTDMGHKPRRYERGLASLY